MHSGYVEREARIGLNLLTLAANFHLWVSRRLERIEFVDHQTISRSIRLDLDMTRVWGGDRGVAGPPRDIERWPSWGDRFLVPLTMLPRSRHSFVEVRDAADCLVSRLTNVEERGLLCQGITKAVRQRGHEISAETQAVLCDVVHGESTPDPRVALKRTPQGGMLLADEVLMTFVNIAAKTALLAVPIDERLSRQVLTFSTMQAFSPNKVAVPGRNRATRGMLRVARLAAHLWQRVGCMNLRLDSSGANYGSSFHLEVPAPYNLEFASVQLEIEIRDANAKPFGEVVVDPDRIPTLAHVHLAENRTVQRAWLLADLRHVPTGIVRSACLSSLFTAVILVAGALDVYLREGHDFGPRFSVDAGAALLLIVPGVIGTIIVIPTTHSLTAKLTFTIRLLLGVCSLMPWFCGLSVAFGIRGWLNVVAWTAPASIATVCAVILCRTFIRLAVAAKTDRPLAWLG